MIPIFNVIIQSIVILLISCRFVRYANDLGSFYFFGI